MKVLGASFEDVLVCAEYTGRYIYPLTVACQELDIFLWMDDPTRIKNSMGLTRGKNDAIDAARIAEYAFRYSDKAVRYAIPDAAMVSMKNLLADREFLLVDKKRYQSQLTDQKKYMAPGDFKHKNSRWKKVIKSIDEQIAAIDAEIESLIATDPVLARQKELLVSIDGIGEHIAINMLPECTAVLQLRRTHAIQVRLRNVSSVKGQNIQTCKSNHEGSTTHERSERGNTHESRGI